MPLTEGLVSRTSCKGPPKQSFTEKRKKKTYAAVLKFNKCHDDTSGKFSSACGTGTGGDKGQEKATGTGSKSKLSPAQQQMQEQLETRAKKPVHKVDTAEQAVELILKGEKVEIKDTKHVHTVIKKLGEIAAEAHKKGEKAPNIDLCNVTVSGVNAFCTESIKTEEFPHGIPRIEMPQFGGHAIPGTEADKLPKDAKGGVDAAPAFLKHLEDSGVKTSEGKLLAIKMKASQAQLVGVKVAGIMTSGTDVKQDKIWVSRDGYVIDGHHRWAASLGQDAEDGILDNDKEMNVTVVDMPMSEVYHLAVKWTKKFGMKPAAA